MKTERRSKPARAARRAVQATALAFVAVWGAESCRFPDDAFECTEATQCTAGEGPRCEDHRCVYDIVDDSGAGGSGGGNGGSGAAGSSAGGAGGDASANGGNDPGTGGGEAGPGMSNDGGVLPPGAPRLTVVAGKIGGGDYIDGKGALARFMGPGCVAYDGKQYLYVAQGIAKTIRRMDIRTMEVTTIAGRTYQNDYQEGVGELAHFNEPECLTYDEDSGVPYLFITEFDGHRIRKVDLRTNTSSLVAGYIPPTTPPATPDAPPPPNEEAGYVNAAGTSARFKNPQSLVRGNGKLLYVADSGNNAIRTIDLGTNTVTTLAGALDGTGGQINGALADARFDTPVALAFDRQNNRLYVGQGNSADIRMIDVTAGTVSTIVPNVASTAQIELDAANNRLFVADMSSNRLLSVNLTQKNFTTISGANPIPGDADGPPGTAGFASPAGIVLVDPNTLFVSDFDASTIRKVVADANGVWQTTTVAGLAPGNGYVDGKGTDARFWNPADALLGPDGRTLYVSEENNCLIRTYDTEVGAVATFAGGADGCLSRDGTGKQASFNAPTGLAFGTATGGKKPLLYVSEAVGVIRSVNIETGEVKSLNAPIAGAPKAYGLAVTDSVIYGTAYDFRQIAVLPLAGGVAQNFLGTEDYGCSDAQTFAAVRFGRPAGILWDGATNLYVADSECGRIWQIDLTARTMKAIAGGADDDGSGGFPDGIGTSARLQFPGPLAWSQDRSSMFIGDQHVLRRLDLDTKKVTTLIGVPEAGGGVWVYPNPPRLSFPGGLVETASGDIYMTSENAILKYGKP